MPSIFNLKAYELNKVRRTTSLYEKNSDFASLHERSVNVDKNKFNLNIKSDQFYLHSPKSQFTHCLTGL